MHARCGRAMHGILIVHNLLWAGIEEKKRENGLKFGNLQEYSRTNQVILDTLADY